MSEVLVVPTGTANLASMLAAIARAGLTPALADDPERVLGAERVVLPGVGSFGAAMAAMKVKRLDEAVRARIAADRPTLCVCVGLQVLGERSEESPGVDGLGIVPAAVTRFPATVRVPQLGWNAIAAAPRHRFLASGAVYFANSYRFTSAPPGFVAATADHGGPFVAAIERGSLLGCQFHPELSGRLGAEILARWLGGEP